MPPGIADNYVDELFLKGMAHKNSFPDLHYPNMIKQTLEIIHVINSVVLQISLFQVLVTSEDDESNIENVIMLANICVSVVGYLIFCYYKMFEKSTKTLSQILFQGEFFNNVKSILFLSMILRLITPVLASLTVAYSDDTIILDYISK